MKTLFKRIFLMFLISLLAVLSIGLGVLYLSDIRMKYLSEEILLNNFVTLNRMYFEEIVLQTQMQTVPSISARDKLIETIARQEKLISSTFHNVDDIIGYVDSNEWKSGCRIPTVGKKSLCHINGSDRIVGIIPIAEDQKLLGYVVKEADKNNYLIEGERSFVFYLFLGMIGAFFLTFSGVLLFFKKTVNCDLRNLLYKLSDRKRGVDNDTPILKTTEFHLIDNTITKTLEELSRAQFEKAELAKQMEIANTAAKVAHDIRSPLASLQDALGFLKESPGGMNSPKMLNLIESAANKIKNIADDLLDQHKERTAEAVYSVHRILDELVGEYREAGKYPNITFVKQYAQEAIHICGDRIKLQRAFGNIIQNSLEAMRDNGTITIATEIKNGDALVSIKDTGCGIPQESLKRVLEGGYTDGKKNGHGIGMTVVREAVREHHGKLCAESEVNKGTCFYIRLPLPSEETEVSAEKDPGYLESITIDVYDGSVVIIEDSEEMRATWKLKLESKVENVILCEDHEDYQRKGISSNIAKTAIIDFHFDNKIYNGIQVARELKGDGFKYLLICSGDYWHPHLQHLAREAGVPVCPKPLPEIRVRDVRGSDSDATVFKNDPEEIVRLQN